MTKTRKKPSKTKDLKQVQDHYLDYPYPHRNPEDDKTRLLKIYGDYLGELSHWLFEGKRRFYKRFPCSDHRWRYGVIQLFIWRNS